MSKLHVILKFISKLCIVVYLNFLCDGKIKLREKFNWYLSSEPIHTPIIYTNRKGYCKKMINVSEGRISPPPWACWVVFTWCT